MPSPGASLSPASVVPDLEALRTAFFGVLWGLPADLASVSVKTCASALRPASHSGHRAGT